VNVELVTRAEYARRRGVAKSAVTQAIQAGRISLINGKVDPAVADIQWERNSRARADSGKPAAPTAPSLAASGPSVDVLPPSSTDEGEYSVNRARRERYEADLAQMKLLEQQGDLVRVAEVRAEIAKQVGQLKTNLLQIPARLGHLLTAEARMAVDAELRQALQNSGAA
jgi:hypothetical protein